MQALTASPREHLTAAQVEALIVDAPAMTVGYGAELVDQSLTVLADISEHLQLGGQVARSSYAELHGTARLPISTELDWGRAIIRPYMTIADGQLSARFNLGAYFTSTPRRNLRTRPPTYNVAGYDILKALQDPVGDTYALDSGVSYLIAVESILVERGFVQYLIDRSASSLVLPSPKVWAFDDRTTWLTIVNDLLAAIGYAGIWSDWEGRLRCHPYQPPALRPAEWEYEADGVRSMIAPDRNLDRDIWDAPNRWVFYRRNDIEASPPVEGAGMYTFVNQSTGDTSVDARGRVISRVEGLDAADHASLVQQAQEKIDADLRLPTVYIPQISPNPLHWHFDRLRVVDPAAGPPLQVLATQWAMPLGRGLMTHEWTALP